MTRSPMPAECRGCGAPLYAKGQPTPGARRHCGRGLCSTCWKHDTGVHQPRMVMPEVCGGCSAALYPQGHPRDGAVEHGGHGLCVQCYRVQAYESRRGDRPRRRKMPDACEGCARPLRRPGTPREEGAVVFAADGLCGSCWHARSKGRPGVTPRPERVACDACGEPMTTKGNPKPGHVVHRTNGLCTTCHSRADTARRRQDKRENDLIAWMLGGAA